jgi:hypothetical protein
MSSFALNPDSPDFSWGTLSQVEQRLKLVDVIMHMRCLGDMEIRSDRQLNPDLPPDLPVYSPRYGPLPPHPASMLSWFPLAPLR